MPVLQSSLGFAPWTDPRKRRLPGVQPLGPDDWLIFDDALPGQMAERDRLIADVPQAVHRLAPETAPAAAELLEAVIAALSRLDGYDIGAGQVTRPDGIAVPLDRTAPLLTLGRLVQQDYCILQKRGAEHVLTGAILCFPASWRLDEKFGRPLTDIHAPVTHYTAEVAARVQRLFDAVRPGAPLWRANVLHYADPALHQPRSVTCPRAPEGAEAAFIRSERQVILRLPETRAVVFSIHTVVVHRDALSPEQAAALQAS